MSQTTVFIEEDEGEDGRRFEVTVERWSGNGMSRRVKSVVTLEDALGIAAKALGGKK